MCPRAQHHLHQEPLSWDFDPVGLPTAPTGVGKGTEGWGFSLPRLTCPPNRHPPCPRSCTATAQHSEDAWGALKEIYLHKAPGALHVKESSRPQAPSYDFHPGPRGHMAGHRQRPRFTPSASKIPKHVPGTQQRFRGSGTVAGVLRGWLCVCALAPLAKASVSSSRINFHKRNSNFPTHAALPFARLLRSQG